MKRITLALLLIVLVLTACASVLTSAPADGGISITEAPAVTSAPTDVLVNSKIPAASFESQTYINQQAGFALDYPAQWTVNESVIGDRGSQVQFLSSPEIGDLAVLPEGATRVSAVIYQWDPKNDLTAYVDHWKTAWDASGSTIVEEQQLILDLGLNAVQFVIQIPDSSAVFLITAIGDQYLVIGGEGNLELVKEIAQRLRPVSAQ